MPEPEYSRSNRWLTVIQFDDPALPKDVRQALENHNIESRPVWNPMHCQPVFRDCKVYGGDVAESLFRHGLCLPSGTTLTPEIQSRITALIKSAL